MACLVITQNADLFQSRPRKSSLRRPGTPPAHRDGAKVSFSPAKPISAVRLFHVDEPSVLVNAEYRRRTLTPLLKPRRTSETIALAERQSVVLEEASFEYPILRGTVVVNNLAFEKEVFVRLTTDDWQSFTDVRATYHDKVPTAFANLDRFKFEYDLENQFIEAGHLALCVCASFDKKLQFWDNNNMANYTADMLVELFYPEGFVDDSITATATTATTTTSATTTATTPEVSPLTSIPAVATTSTPAARLELATNEEPYRIDSYVFLASAQQARHNGSPPPNFSLSPSKYSFPDIYSSIPFSPPSPRPDVVKRITSDGKFVFDDAYSSPCKEPFMFVSQFYRAPSPSPLPSNSSLALINQNWDFYTAPTPTPLPNNSSLNQNWDFYTPNTSVTGSFLPPHISA